MKFVLKNKELCIHKELCIKNKEFVLKMMKFAVLFDEVEKAHKEVLNVLLQVGTQCHTSNPHHTHRTFRGSF